MPIHMCWDDDENHVIRYDFIDPWTWTEFFDAIQADDMLIASVDHTVHLLFNAENSHSIPANPIARFRSIAEMISPQTGLLVVAGTNVWFQKLSQIFFRLYGDRVEGMIDVKITTSVDDARRVIVDKINSSR